MKIVVVSDTHGQHGALEIPDGDVFVHCGDFAVWSADLEELERFDEFLADLPHPHKLLVAGNHDGCFQEHADQSRERLTHARYLQDELVEIDGVRFYGSPWQPEFLDLAFNLPRGEPLRRVWARVPENTDVLITHTPPHGIRDRTHGGSHVGCEELRLRVEEIAPRLHLFGHIHESRGMAELGPTTFVNASSPGGKRGPFVVEI